MTVARKSDPYRNALYAKIQIGRKALGLDEDVYRDLLDARFGKRSLTKLTTAQLVDLVEHFKGLGFKPRKQAPKRAGRARLADGATQRKIRALWISLYHLGVVNSPAEQALDRFVKRIGGVDSLRFLTPGTAYKVIEALKSWAERDGGVDWGPYATVDGPVYRPRGRVMEAQWRMLARLGVVRIADVNALSGWVERFVRSPCAIHHAAVPAVDADRVIEALGAKIRSAKGRGAGG